MSVITKALNAIRETIKLADDVKRTAETVKNVLKNYVNTIDASQD
jgi:hypothetical protein